MTKSPRRRAERRPSTADFPKKKRAQHPRDVQGSRILLLPSPVAGHPLAPAIITKRTAAAFNSPMLDLFFMALVHLLSFFQKLARAVQNPASACWYCASASDTAACCCMRSARSVAFWL